MRSIYKLGLLMILTFLVLNGRICNAGKVSAEDCTKVGTECSGITHAVCNKTSLKCQCDAGFKEDSTGGSTCIKSNRKRCSRKTPNKHAEEWIKREEDPPGFAVRFFENKGRGVITTTAREKGEFLLVYRGEVVTKEEGERREEKDGGTWYRLFYKASGKQLWQNNTKT